MRRTSSKRRISEVVEVDQLEETNNRRLSSAIPHSGQLNQIRLTERIRKSKYIKTIFPCRSCIQRLHYTAFAAFSRFYLVCTDHSCGHNVKISEYMSWCVSASVSFVLKWTDTNKKHPKYLKTVELGLEWDLNLMSCTSSESLHLLWPNFFKNQSFLIYLDNGFLNLISSTLKKIQINNKRKVISRRK